ncbi:hypothetical protein GCM10023201_40690 [Actinomycetospora corticicola]|uniref:Uncharacterized protein n=1 Tax=Actinomycetospora corticicola TaxID=663602 RepID=A0A7Y9J636_9PSEU|nr:hypothetical protein [Actinomycetospora corticicola]NYD36847.1 hypothetical protein [Actinomycetospora corticicola]
MGDITQPQPEAEHEHLRGVAKLTVSKTPDSATVSAILPEKQASDLLPMFAMSAITVAPWTTFWLAGTTDTPWWVSAPVGLVQLVAVTFVYLRARPSTR